VPETPVTDEVAETARRIAAGEGTADDGKIVGGGVDVRDLLGDLENGE
jgi:hypothetical protein